MFLTLYYVAATYVQSWRFRNVCNKITEKIAGKNSVAFYSIPIEGNEIVSSTSELCTNRSQARISDFLWLRNNQRGCSLIPLQKLHLAPWISFPEPPNLIPFELSQSKLELQLNEDNLIYLLLETDVIPLKEKLDENFVVMIEEYGKPIAWKIDSHFAVLLQSDIDHFTKLIISTFMQDNFTINDHLPLIRIESVCYEGQPQPFELIKNHLQKQLISRAVRQLSDEDWQKHLVGLRSLSVLASQATEFEYNKNRTEGKTGIVKPDLIPSTSLSKNTDEILTSTSLDSKRSPAKKVISSPRGSPIKIEAKVSPMRRAPEEPVPSVSPKGSPLKPSPLKSSPSQAMPISFSPSKTSPSKSALYQQKAETPKKEEIQLLQKVTEIVQNDSHIPTSSSEKIETETNTIKKASVSNKPIEETTKTFIASESDTAESNQKKKPEPIISVQKDNTKRPSLKRNKRSLSDNKPPNILVYSNSASAKDSVISSLKDILQPDTYTIYSLTLQQIAEKIWADNTFLLIVCGTIENQFGEILLDYFLRGGRMLSLCSDVLHIVLPTYRTAEVREHELVQFSYGKWEKIKMMHHIFCYQPSPVRKHFSTDSEDSSSTLTKKPSIEMKDLQGSSHNLDVKILGSEETWNTPSILLANDIKSGGKAVFSQIHLETDPSQFEYDESKYNILKRSDKARLEILADLLKSYLDIKIKDLTNIDTNGPKCVYKNAYFLGMHEEKFELLGKLKEFMDSNEIIQTKNIALRFCGKNVTPPKASTNLLPILIHSCPEDFSTVEYFENLKTTSIGRLVIYAPIISSSQHVISDLTLVHGIAVIPRHQTEGSGRHSNQWLSPSGCAMFSIQLHFDLNSKLGQKISFVQHLVTIAIVNSVLKRDGYENLEIKIKWPNDIYSNKTKIGGSVVNTTVVESKAICNIGVGVNLTNSSPTTCINDIISEYNSLNHKKLPQIGYEEFIASIFNDIEELINLIELSDLKKVYDLYYKYWMHSNQEVKIMNKNNVEKNATIIGIDDYGYLKVQTNDGTVDSVQPDGNSFDMIRGLILPK
ncbi:biotin--protein ligase isoform X2 [Condylostylus longicornis]|uniref:biotin--protein ligase isoform X2 n=1 Tax=Condylostylus longicornis TaxID=2530218 RepID=UPI00244DE388|nr:biotin--protein ligase isoform X2 [Condylostylus longicornis]